MERPITTVKGETHTQVLGTEQLDEFAVDRQFVADHLHLALKLRHTRGMQELMKGVRQMIPGQTATHRQKIAAHSPALSIIRQGDEWLRENLAKLDEAARIQLERQMLQWVEGFPPLAEDFSAEECEIIARNTDSRLVAVYREHLPGKVATTRLGQTALNSGH